MRPGWRSATASAHGPAPSQPTAPAGASNHTSGAVCSHGAGRNVPSLHAERYPITIVSYLVGQSCTARYATPPTGAASLPLARGELQLIQHGPE